VDDFPWFAILFGIVLAAWIYKLVAHGGLRGAMFGARIKNTVELRATTLASYRMQSVPLTKAQARALSQLLARAAE